MINRVTEQCNIAIQTVGRTKKKQSVIHQVIINADCTVQWAQRHSSAAVAAVYTMPAAAASPVPVHRAQSFDIAAESKTAVHSQTPAADVPSAADSH